MRSGRDGNDVSESMRSDGQRAMWRAAFTSVVALAGLACGDGPAAITAVSDPYHTLRGTYRVTLERVSNPSSPYFDCAPTYSCLIGELSSKRKYSSTVIGRGAEASSDFGLMLARYARRRKARKRTGAEWVEGARAAAQSSARRRARTLAIVVASTRSTTLARRARQSMLFTWSARITPVTDRSPEIETSNG